ncbi:uncharacterized protein PITG_14082 [Phytophthora infestans T30-4]|uniref:Uncharacterized protein n=2 Tax=Phytophthora infestans TaxID=4787 RepID=D0NNL0_PHYIT|nr:uncharacterized protein PITG_14082 [Phytophthora infestans T30-4]EEY62181.1 hypothetical protein PITG_14082 [Phytophthora infestans T30-4]|eukprot:XP_002899212.1 hypothetical protein PITG_14082 [Phytophthora infestans T30-4]
MARYTTELMDYHEQEEHQHDGETKQEHGRPPTQERKDRGKAMLDFKRQKLEEISKLRREEVELKKLELVEKAQQTDRAHEIRMREI